MLSTGTDRGKLEVGFDMTELTVQVPEQLKAFVDAEVAAGASASASDFLCRLIAEAQKRKVRERLEALLQQGLDSGPATPMTADDWKELRSELHERLARDGNS